jgi:DNA-binding response OmpR family regulator
MEFAAMRILVVEDDSVLLDGLTMGLMLHGMVTNGVETCEDAYAALATAEYSAVVLDLMLPDGSGIDVLRYMRDRGNLTPVLLLTARDAVTDRVLGLDEGADDYLGKPFDLDEVAARLRALDRRAAGRATPRLAWHDIVLDPGRIEVTVDGRAVSLSRREFTVLWALMDRPGTVFSRAQLEARLYGWQDDVESNAIEVHIHNLRAKIGKNRIQTIRGLGYRLYVEGS